MSPACFPYPLVRPLLFALAPETAHELAIAAMRTAGWLGVLPAAEPWPDTPAVLMGLTFPNRIGLAAGLDKNGEVIDALAGWGFGFLEVGTVTPRPQPGNPKPRLFRLPEAEAIINRMGFNNHGVDAVLANVRAAKFRGILGINIGKNFDTPIERAVDDYLACLDKVYAVASYVAVNISSPNTQNLRALQEASAFDALLIALKRRQAELAEKHGRHVPILPKIAPDLDEAQIQAIADALRRHRLDGVIATNTTLARSGIEHLPQAKETGGLSGRPLFERSTAVLRQLAAALGGELPIIAAGGVLDGAMARAKIEAGAALVQIYSGLIFRGPALVRECVAATRQSA